MYLCNWWRLTKRRMHEREVELAFSGQRVAAERHGDLLHRDLEAGRRERLDEDVGRSADSSKRGRAVGRHRMHQGSAASCVPRSGPMTLTPSRPTMEIAAPTTSPDALSRAIAESAPSLSRSVCRARFRSKPVACSSIAATASKSAEQQLLRISTSALTQPLSLLASPTRRLVTLFVTP